MQIVPPNVEVSGMTTRSETTQAACPLDRKVSHRCEHRVGGYTYAPRIQAGGTEELCGKPATYVAAYPGKQESYFCKKHAQTRNFITKIEWSANGA